MKQRLEQKPKYFKETPKQVEARPKPTALQEKPNLEGWCKVAARGGKRKALGDITDGPQRGTGEVKRGRPTTLSKAEQGQRPLAIAKKQLERARRQTSAPVEETRDTEMMQENAQVASTQ